MKVKVLGNHSAYHCGCAAVWQVLHDALKTNGVDIVEHGDFDALVVNGEGSMHHGRPTFHKKMRALADAHAQGKQTYLVNSVWQDNPPDYDGLLMNAKAIAVREELSRRDLLVSHGREAEVCLDYSYFADVGIDDRGRRLPGGLLRTDYFSPACGDFVDFSHPELEPIPRISLKAMTWSELVGTLRSTAMLVSGRHHAIYAACKARTPFAAIEGNSHKIRGLIASSGIEIPIATTVEELIETIAWTKRNTKRFERLFDWMETQAAKFAPSMHLPHARREV